MARQTRAAKPGRAILALFLLAVVLYGTVAGAHFWGTGQLTPKLGLDLEGGDEIVLTPIIKGGSVSQQTINEAINIIRARVNGSGVSEAQVSSQGGDNIVVDLPGKNISEKTKNLVKQAAQLRFRAVIEEADVTPVATPTPTSTGTATSGTTATGTATGGATAKATASSGATATATPAGTATSSAAGAALPQALLDKAGSGVKAATSTSTATPTATATPSATPTASGATTPTAAPTDASDPNWVTPAIAAQFAAETCQDTTSLQGNTDDPNKPFVTCSSDKLTKFVLGPVEVFGTDIKSAQAGLVPGANGIATTNWQVELTFNGAGTSKFAKVTERLVNLPSPRNQFAVVVDGLVISDPVTQQAIVGGDAQITSPTFTQSTSTALAQQLKYGALPISFNVLTENQISPTLGAQSLQKSLIAGLIGLVLVVLYALLQYRLLGLVTVASLSLSALLTYGSVVYLGWAQGFRLSLAGVTGLIVSIGITADSFIVFFERVRDEVREGRALRSAVETGWARGRRTILAADSVSFLAAVVLYILAAGSVQGFAFTLGLTTIIDVIIVFLFTHPMLQLLARTEFFGGGHKWSGLDPNRLGTNARRKRPAVGVPVPAGAGGAATVAAPKAMTIAERRAAAERAARAERSGDQGEDA